MLFNDGIFNECRFWLLQIVQNRILQSGRNFLLVAENDSLHLCAMGNFKLIDYDYTRDGSFRNGVMSDLDDEPEVIWAYDRHGRSKSGTAAEARCGGAIVSNSTLAS